MKHLELYYKWLKQGYLDGQSGLCKAYNLNGYSYAYLSQIFFTNSEGIICWEKTTLGEFTELRQTIVLLLAAQDNEL